MKTQVASHLPTRSGAPLLATIGALSLLLGSAPAQPSSVGQWAPVRDLTGSIVARPVHSVLMSTGKVFFYPTSDDTKIWDPIADTITNPPNFGYNPFCNGHTQLADGRILSTGGHIENFVGLPNASIYNPMTNAFTQLPNMNAGRWYPTQVTLSNGDVVTMSGRFDKGENNNIPQVWQVSSESWRTLSSAELEIVLYPAAFLAPNGKVFVATSTSRYLDTAGTGAWTTVANRLNPGRDNYGSACMYEPGKVIYTGGADAPVATTEAIDLTNGTPTWKAKASMPQKRRQHNATLLPDGRVLVTGGSSASGFNTTDGGKPAIVWDPVANVWTSWATETNYRGYHSVAVLLPDGRVASIGGDKQNNLQVFSPPYLFKGARPTISSAPTGVALGTTFFVGTPNPTSIAKVTWTRPSSVTHTKNMDQRFNALSFSQAAGGLNITAPSSPNNCPPGYYMLWLIDGAGVPSVSAMIQVL